MKKVIGSVAVLAAVVLCGYYGTGLITEHTLKKNMERINRSNGITVEMNAYQRGWFHSNAQLTWHIQMPERFIKSQNGNSALVPSKVYTFTTPIEIYHGPVIIATDGVHFGLGYANTEVNIPDAYKKQYDAAFLPESIAPVLKANLFVNYLRRCYLSLNVPSFRLVTVQDKDVIEWEGLTSEFSLSPEKYHVDGQFELKGLRVVSGAMSLALGKVNSDYDMQQNQQGLYLGELSIAFPSLVIMKNNTIDLSLEDVDTQSESEVKDGLFGSSFHGSFGKLVTHGKTYGPARIAIALENLDAVVLAAINEQANKMQHVPDSERQQALLLMLPQLPKLLGKGAAFEVSELNLKTPSGTLDGSVRVVLPQGDLGNPFQLIQKIDGNGKLKIPSLLLKSLLTPGVTEALLLQAEKEKALAQEPVAAPVATAEQPVPAAEQPPTAPAESTAPATVVDDVPVTMTSDELNQKVSEGISKKIADLVQAGAIQAQGDDFYLDVKLSAGQLSINGHPFNPAMLQF